MFGQNLAFTKKISPNSGLNKMRQVFTVEVMTDVDVPLCVVELSTGLLDSNATEESVRQACWTVANTFITTHMQ